MPRDKNNFLFVGKNKKKKKKIFVRKNLGCAEKLKKKLNFRGGGILRLIEFSILKTIKKNTILRFYFIKKKKTNSILCGIVFIFSQLL